MIPDSGGNPESSGTEPEQLSRLIEMELAEKRAHWKEAAARRQKIRTASYFFLFLLIVASLLAFFALFSRVKEERANPRVTPAPSISRP
jgi:hypothetical protein